MVEKVCAVLSPSVMSNSLFDPKDCNLPCSSVHGDSPDKNTRVGSIPFSRESFQPGDQTQVSHTAGGFFIIWATMEAQEYWSG